MSPVHRLWLLLAAFSLLLLPLATAHTLALHGEVDAILQWHTLREPAGAMTVVLTFIALLPLVGALRASRDWLRANGRLRYLTKRGVGEEWCGIAYRRLPGGEVAFFTAGLFRPQIYATDNALRSLPPQGVRAALLHEEVHMERRDAFWLSLIALERAAFNWIPGARVSFDGLRFQVERSADVLALQRGANAVALFDAIVAASGATPASAAPLSDGLVLERLRFLAGSGDKRPTGRLGPALIGAVLLGLPLATHAMLLLGEVCTGCNSHLV